MGFFTTAEQAIVKSLTRARAFILQEAPKFEAELSLAEGVAKAALPKNAALIDAVGNASDHLFSHAITFVNNEKMFQDALQTGKITLDVGAEAIQSLKDLAPATIDLVHAAGLGHTVAPPVKSTP